MEFANKLSVFLPGIIIGVILFQTVVVAPTVFKSLGAELASPFLRAIFPRLFLFVALCGFARRAFDAALARVETREIQGSKLSNMQMIQGHIADMATSIDTSALLVYRAAWAKDQGQERITREAAMAKFYATEEAQKVIDQALQIHGGDGVKSGVLVEKLYREIRALRIYEGASDVQKIIMARQVLAEKIGG